jgi:hypothetical protein
MPPPTVTERDFSNAFGGLRKTLASSPSGLNNALYKCLASKNQDKSSHPERLSLSRMMAIPITHGFYHTRHLTFHECAIHKKPGNHKSETMRIIHIFEAMENQSLKISVSLKIKPLVKLHTGIFRELQFGRPKSTCISAIILKTLSTDIINITKTTAIINDIDTAKAFDLVVNKISLLALRSLGFTESRTTMICKRWSGRWCCFKTAYGVSS